MSTDISRGAKTQVLSLFPAASRLLILPDVQAVHRSLAGNPASAKVLRTIRSRRLHYLVFCFYMKLDDDWLLEHQPQERANFQLAMYATHLATGSSLLCKTLKASTINSYLLDVATFIGCFRPIDPRHVSAANKTIAPRSPKSLRNKGDGKQSPIVANLSPSKCTLRLQTYQWMIVVLPPPCLIGLSAIFMLDAEDANGRKPTLPIAQSTHFLSTNSGMHMLSHWRMCCASPLVRAR